MGWASEPQNEATKEVLPIYAVTLPRELAPVVDAMSVALVSETLREDRSKFLRRRTYGPGCGAKACLPPSKPGYPENRPL